MNTMFAVTTVFIFAIAFSSPVIAAEHGGKAQTQEHGGTAVTMPSNEDIRNAMKDYVMEMSKATGTFDVMDQETGKTRKLELQRVHERVGKTGDYYYSCADFKDTETGQMLDLDLDVADKDGKLSVADVRIHKLEGEERYTYDENDNRIPVKTEDSHEHDGKEHGGKEHGGK